MEIYIVFAFEKSLLYLLLIPTMTLYNNGK